LSTAQGGSLGGTLTVNAVNGVATFSDLFINKAATAYAVTASSGALSTVTSAIFEITAGAPSKLVFKAPPPNAIAGFSLPTVQVALLDALDNLTPSTLPVTLALGGGNNATLGGTSTVSAVNGLANFSGLVITKAAKGYTLVASALGINDVSSSAFDVSPGPITALAFSSQPGTGTAGRAFSPTLRVSFQDAYANTVQSSGTLHVALKPNAAGATLGGTLDVDALNGVATFPDLFINRASAGYKLTASFGPFSVDSAAFEIKPGPATRLVVRSNPGDTVAGERISALQVEIQDDLGNRVSDASQPVSVALSPAQGGTLLGTLTVQANSGAATFGDLVLKKAAQGYALTVAAAGLASASSTAFNVTPAAAAGLVFTVPPGMTQAGTALSPSIRVSLQDAFGNLATQAQDPVTLALDANPGADTLNGTQTVAAINGVATFADLVLNRAASGYTLKATSGALPAVTSAAFEITSAAPARLVFVTGPVNVRAGESLGTLRVALQDALGNPVANFSGDITLSLGQNTTGASLLGTTSAPIVNGVATFTGVNVRKTGTGYTLIASGNGVAGATSAGFNIAPAAAASYSLSLPPNATAGQEAELSVRALDAFGNLATSSTETVSFTSSDRNASLPARVGFTEGVLTGLKVTFRTAGSQTVTVSSGALSATAQTNVTPFALPQVAITSPAQGDTVSGQVSITASASVAAGTTLTRLSVSVDGQELASNTEGTLTATWDTTRLANNSVHSLTAVVVDAAGNSVTSSEVTVTVHRAGCGCNSLGSDASVLLALLALGHRISRKSTRRSRGG